MLDYHIHTSLCGHARGEMWEYVETAIAQSLQEIGFSDHLPMVKWAHPEYAMPFDALPTYIQHVSRLRQQYPQIPIKLGIEADYYTPAEEQATREILARYPFDYIYGSVHFIDGWAIDDPRYIAEWEQRDVNQVYAQYFTLLQHAIQSGLFDIIGHFDLVKKFGYRPTQDLSALIEATVRCCKESEVIVEINTAGLRKPVHEIYPSLQILRLLRQYDVPIVLGSDAHAPDEVGRDFAHARDIARQLGHTAVVVVQQRQIVGTYPL